MKGNPLGAAVLLGLMLSIAIAPTADAFGGRGGHGGRGAFGGRPPGFHQSRFSHGFKGGPKFHGHAFGFDGRYNRSFPGMDTPGPGFGFGRFPGFKGFNPFFFNGGGWFGPWGTTTVYYGSGYDSAGPANYPVTYYAPQYYAPTYPSPAVYAPPMGGSVSVAPVPPTPSVVSFPGGRYELRGDGVTAPYQWVWIPNPPPVPPAPPTSPPADAAPSSGDGPAARRSQLYRWTDENGTVHWTNRGEAVPAKYRNEATHKPPA